jgi:hypothetical protein
MTRDQWREIEQAPRDPKVQFAMERRCEEQGHQWKNGPDIFMRTYEFCKWYGERK